MEKTPEAGVVAYDGGQYVNKPTCKQVNKSIQINLSTYQPIIQIIQSL